MKEQSFAAGAVKLNYFEGPPSGYPLMLLHGITGRWQSFTQLMPFLTPYYHVYAIDLRGHGKSDHVSGGYDVQAYVDDIAAFIQGVIGKPAALFGHSMGGRVSLQLALSHPELVSALVVGDTPLTPIGLRGDKDDAFVRVFGLWKELADKKLPLHELALALGDLPARPKPDGTPQHYKDFWSHTDLLYTARCIQLVDGEVLAGIASRASSIQDEVLGKLGGITCPVLFLQAEPDMGGLLTDSELETALQIMPDAYGVRIHGAGHGIHTDRPISVAQAANDFLTAHDL